MTASALMALIVAATVAVYAGIAVVVVRWLVLR